MEVSLVHDPHRRFWFARFEMYIALLMMMDNRYAAQIQILFRDICSNAGAGASGENKNGTARHI